MKTKAFNRFRSVYISLVLLFLYLPILVVILYSFNTTKYGAEIKGFTLDWYRQMISDRRIVESLWVSIQVALAASALSCAVGTLGAVAAGSLGKRLKSLLNGLIYIPLIIPEIVFGVALMMVFSVLPVEFGRLTLVLAHTTFCIPYVYVLVGIRLRSVSRSVIEAARDLGAKPAALLRTIILPLISPAILSAGLLSLAMSLDDVVISEFVFGPETVPLPVRVYSMLKLGLNPKINALCTFIFIFSLAAVSGLQLAVRNKSSRD